MEDARAETGQAGEEVAGNQALVEAPAAAVVDVEAKGVPEVVVPPEWRLRLGMGACHAASPLAATPADIPCDV